MAVNIAVSSMALIRYDLRAEGKPPKNSVESIIDERFDDARMEKIIPTRCPVRGRRREERMKGRKEPAQRHEKSHILK